MSPALAGRFFTTHATWEAALHPQMTLNDTKSSDDPKVFMQVKITADSLKERNFAAAVFHMIVSLEFEFVNFHAANKY